MTVEPREALADFEASLSGNGIRDPMKRVRLGAIEAALKALRAQVAAEEAKQPKRPALWAMEETVRAAVVTAHSGNGWTQEGRAVLLAAADAIKVVREDLVPWLREKSAAKSATETQKISGVSLLLAIEADRRLRALGEEP